MQTNQLTEKNKYLLICFIHEVARTIPHSFLTIYLLSSGISLSDISKIQICYMIAITVFEVPSGVLADKFSKRKIFFFSCILMMIAYSFYIKIISVAAIAFAQFLYGAASALQTGTVEVLVINQLKTDRENAIEEVIRQESIVSTSAMIIGSLLGIRLFYTGLHSNVYFLAVLFFFLAGVVALSMKENVSPIEKSDFNIPKIFKHCSQHLLQGAGKLFAEKRLLLTFTVIALLQFILQPFFNYWQPISTSKGISEQNLGIIYISMQLITILASVIYKHVKIKSVSDMVLILFIGFSMIAALVTPDKPLFLILFLFSIMPRTFISIKWNSYAQTLIENDFRSTITSISSMYSRIFSIAALSVAGLLAGFEKSAGSILLICSLIYMIVSILLIICCKKLIRGSKLKK